MTTTDKGAAAPRGEHQAKATRLEAAPLRRLRAIVAACGAAQSTPCQAPTPGQWACAVPAIATCLEAPDAGALSPCETTADTACGLAAGASAQMWLRSSRPKKHKDWFRKETDDEFGAYLTFR